MGKKAANKAARKLQKEAIEAIRITAAEGQINEDLLAHLKRAGVLAENFDTIAEEGNNPAMDENVSMKNPPIAGYEWIAAVSPTGPPEACESRTESCMTPPTSSSNASDETISELDHAGNGLVREGVRSILVARCLACERMVWFRSPGRSLVKMILPGTSGSDGVVLTCCGRCGVGTAGRELIPDSIMVCATTWLDVEFVCVAKSLAGREMRVLGERGRTTVIDLSSLIKGLLDDEEWGEILLEDYRMGKRGEELMSRIVRGGLL